MIDEYFILIRQSCEVSWLLKYFLKYPHFENDWLSGKKDYIPPKSIRKKLDMDGQMKRTYDALNDNVHPKSKSIFNVFDRTITVGGVFDSTRITTCFNFMLIKIIQFIGILHECIEQQIGISFNKISDFEYSNKPEYQRIKILLSKFFETNDEYNRVKL